MHIPRLQAQFAPKVSIGACNFLNFKFLYKIFLTASDAATLNFNGEQYLIINLPEEFRTQAESLYIRFRTTRPNGLLLTTTSIDPNQHITLLLESGAIRIDLNYGEGQMDRIAEIGSSLNDDSWHTLHIERRGHNFEIEIDQNQKQVIELTGQHYTLHVSAIHVGARFNTNSKIPRKLKHIK